MLPFNTTDAAVTRCGRSDCTAAAAAAHDHLALAAAPAVSKRMRRAALVATVGHI